MRILVIDDNNDSLHSLCMLLRDLGHETVATEDPFLALEEARGGDYPLIISDIRMPGLSGLELLDCLKNNSEGQKPILSDILLITGYADIESAVHALRGGAYDYLNKPIDAAELSRVVERSAEHQRLLRENVTLKENLSKAEETTQELRDSLSAAREQLREVFGVGEVVVESPQMRSLMEQALIFHANPSAPVLIEGETGTGKEILARLIHFGLAPAGASSPAGSNSQAEELKQQARNVETPFVALNCSAIPHELFGSELFGHEPGAFTGSRSEGAPGKLEMAGSGTLFLDEISEMPWDMQPKLLRVLEDRSFYRLGGKRERRFKARIVCAGNRDLENMVESGHFRRDLYHRLSVGHLVLPPLRERRGEIPALAAFFLQREARLKKKKFAGLAPETLALLQTYPWLGNVRELRNAIERAVLLNDGDLLRPEHLSFIRSVQNGASNGFQSGTQNGGQNAGHPGAYGGQKAAALNLTSPATLELPEDSLDLEALYDAVIVKAMEKFGGNKSKAADYLKISRFALHRRLKKEG